MQVKQNILPQLLNDGFALVSCMTDANQVRELACALQEAACESGARRNQSGVYAMRNILRIEAVRKWANGESLRSVLEPALGENYRPVRGILFDKTPSANWKVGWHQDLSIAVRDRVKLDGFGPWSEKAGVIHVQPPREVLGGMLTVRLHLDDCSEENGPLRVVPASHLDGKLTPEQTYKKRKDNGQVICSCSRGGALLMRPLLLHASSPATAPQHRRVVHIEFAAQDLPGGLEWD